MEENEKRKYMAIYLKGLLSMLDECCDARNVHAVANTRQSVIHLAALLEHHDLTAQKLMEIEQQLPRISDSTKELYRAWQKLKGARNEQEKSPVRRI